MPSPSKGGELTGAKVGGIEPQRSTVTGKIHVRDNLVLGGLVCGASRSGITYDS